MKINIKPVTPKASISYMDMHGQASIDFDEAIMLPKTISEEYWDVLIELEVVSNSDGSVYTGKFFENRRRALQAADNGEPHPFAFNPTITGLTPTKISISFNFVDPKNLEMSNQAYVKIRIKEPSLLKTEDTMTSLTPESFSNDKED